MPRLRYPGRRSCRLIMELGGNMQSVEIRCVTVVGAGLMGHGIAQDFAAHGYEVQLYARSQARLDEALANVRSGLAMQQRLGQLTKEQAAATLPRIRPSTDIAQAAAEADFVVEAVYEDLSVKQQIFHTLDGVCPPRAILASTTSSLLPSLLAGATGRPDRVLVTHYFNPPPLVPLVEVVRGPATSDPTVEAVCSVLKDVGKRPALVQKELVGFIANRLQAALLREAFALVERGAATPADIDVVIKYSFGARLGAAGLFEMRDLSGLEPLVPVCDMLFRDLDSSTAVQPFLREKVGRGEVGVKSGQGFYSWTPESVAAAQERIGRALVELVRS
jgi:3-hydroxybutyryl-CoA dehydrogenase